MKQYYSNWRLQSDISGVVSVSVLGAIAPKTFEEKGTLRKCRKKKRLGKGKMP